MDRLANPSIHTVSNNIVDTSYTRFIIIERYIPNNAMDYQTHQWTLFLTILWTLVILDSS